jgi:SAM-dependent methyltransferase
MEKSLLKMRKHHRASSGSSSSGTSWKNIQDYYIHCKKYSENLGKKDFVTWFLKYYVTLKSGGRPILDVGCGAGQVVNRLSREKLYAIGIDISASGVKIAKVDGSGEFIVASATNLPFRNECFRSIGCLDFLEHTKTPEACLREMARVLRIKGRIMVVSPNLFRVIGWQPAYHWHTKGGKQKIANLFGLTRKIVLSRLSPQRMSFKMIEPRSLVANAIGDSDAVCATNPVDVKFFLKKLGFKIISESSTTTRSESAIVERFSGMPIIRSLTGGVFVVGEKCF